MISTRLQGKLEGSPCPVVDPCGKPRRQCIDATARFGPGAVRESGRQGLTGLALP